MEQFKTATGYAIPVDSQVYSLSALLRTCYWLTDRCYVFITRQEHSLLVNLSAKPDSKQELREIAGGFVNSLLDHQLRVELEAQTRGVRELIVAKAFSEGNLLEDPPPGDARDPVAAGVDWNTLLAGSK